MKPILFDPPDIRDNLLPLTFTRPVSEIRMGILRIREKWENMLECRAGWLTLPYLSKKYPAGAGEDNLYIDGSVLPDEGLVRAVRDLSPGDGLYSGNRLLAARPGREQPEDFDPAGRDRFRKIEYLQKVSRIEYPWDIFSGNGSALEADFEMLTRDRDSAELPAGNRVLGTGKLFIEQGARVECAVLNTGSGPIYIGKDAEVMEGSLVRGPFALCEGSTLKLGAKVYGPTSIGPFSKVGGEVNNSIIQGYSNKAHDGFLGNSVLGEWCNIGADSDNSNLKNNYSTVRLWNYREEKFISSGLIFCGLIMGDHSKCGINTMFNTGTVVGVSANIFGTGFPRNFIPSFSWGGPQGFITYRLDKALEVASEVMKRRNVKLDDMETEILSEVFRMTSKYRL
jgi:UDP-N-acetylglucosamine diphosphorylase/glucosamine-1-phosphate N-acetyltransferase